MRENQAIETQKPRGKIDLNPTFNPEASDNYLTPNTKVWKE